MLGAPEIAWLGMARLNAARVALLGTLRFDGAPRISPVEPYFAAGRLLMGAMAWSKKAADLRLDSWYVLHSPSRCVFLELDFRFAWPSRCLFLEPN
jgi:hypothetical protein